MAGINHINGLTHSPGKISQTSKSEQTGAFTNALTQALEKKTDKPESSGTGAPPVSSLGEIPSTGFRMLDPSAIVTEKTDKLLEMLADYARQLEDSDLSLKSIAPVLEQINKKADNLLKETASLGRGNKELRDIATQTVVAAQTEYVRFQRGDYVS